MDIKFDGTKSINTSFKEETLERKCLIINTLKEPSFLAKIDNARISSDLSLYQKDQQLNNKFEDIQNQLQSDIIPKPISLDEFLEKEKEKNKEKITDTLGNIPTEDAYSLTSSIMSAIPGLNTVKVVTSIGSATTRAKLLKENIKDGNASGIISNSVVLAKNQWSAVAGTSKIIHAVAKKGLEKEVFSAKTYGKIEGMNNKALKISSIIELPFAVAGTGLSYMSTAQENKKLNEKRQELDTLLRDNPNDLEGIKNLEDEVSTLKTNRNLKATSSVLSTVSTVSLAVSIKKPTVKSISMATLALTTSVLSSTVSFLSNDKTREELIKKVGLD